MFDLCFVIEYLVSFQLCNYLAGEERERAGCFTFVVF